MEFSGKLRRGEWIALLLFGGVIGYQAFVAPITGLANNGDFGKVLGIFDCAAPIENENRFLSTTYDFHPKHHIWFGFVSSAHLLAGTAILLNSLISKDGALDVRLIGVVHAALYLLAFYLLLPLLRGFRDAARAAVYAVLIFVFADAMYATWLNTFYMDTAALLFLLLSAILYLRATRWQRRSDRIGFAVCAVLFASAKTQHCFLAGPVLLLLWVAGPALGSIAFRAVTAVLVLSAALLTWFIVPAPYHATGMFSVIFYEVTPRSKNVEADLREFGLDSSYQRWVGMYAYSQGAPLDDREFVRRFSSETSYARIGWFFLRHPARAYHAIRNGLDLAGRQRPPMGNFARSSGLPEFTESRSFAFWSAVKRRLFENRGPRYLFYFLGLSLVLCAAALRRGARVFYASACLCMLGWMALLIAAFADAVEVTRHFFIFNAAADLVAVCAVIALLSSLGSARKRATANIRDRAACLW